VSGCYSPSSRSCREARRAPPGLYGIELAAGDPSRRDVVRPRSPDLGSVGERRLVLASHEQHRTGNAAAGGAVLGPMLAVEMEVAVAARPSRSRRRCDLTGLRGDADREPREEVVKPNGSMFVGQGATPARCCRYLWSSRLIRQVTDLPSLSSDRGPDDVRSRITATSFNPVDAVGRGDGPATVASTHVARRHKPFGRQRPAPPAVRAQLGSS
jgi:hypothetical protein